MLDGMSEHTTYSLETGLMDGPMWLLTENNIWVYSYNQGTQDGYYYKFDRTTATWEEDLDCYILGEYEYEDVNVRLFSASRILHSIRISQRTLNIS